jgi:hypothetical protein
VASWDDVRRIALGFPGTSEDSIYDGWRCWRIGKKKSFAWERPLSKTDVKALGAAAPEGPILAVRTEDLEMKEALLRSDPAVYFTTPHFQGYPAVLIRLEVIRLPALLEVLLAAWAAGAPKLVAEAYLRSLD